MTDYYEVLQVSRSCTGDEIRKAYRKLALRHHPDKSSAPDAAEKFKKISEAYQVLSDEQQRRVYDTYGAEGLTGQAQMPQSHHAHRGHDFVFMDPADMFAQFFGDAFSFSAFDDAGFFPHQHHHQHHQRQHQQQHGQHRRSLFDDFFGGGGGLMGLGSGGMMMGGGGEFGSSFGGGGFGSSFSSSSFGGGGGLSESRSVSEEFVNGQHRRVTTVTRNGRVCERTVEVNGQVVERHQSSSLAAASDSSYDALPPLHAHQRQQHTSHNGRSSYAHAPAPPLHTTSTATSTTFTTTATATPPPLATTHAKKTKRTKSKATKEPHREGVPLYEDHIY